MRGLVLVLFTLLLVFCGCSTTNSPPLREPIVVNIYNRLDYESLMIQPALETFYEDEDKYYYFNNIISQYIIVELSDGTTCDVKEALDREYIVINDLDRYGIEYNVEIKPKYPKYKSAEFENIGQTVFFSKYAVNATEYTDFQGCVHIPMAVFSGFESFFSFSDEVKQAYADNKEKSDEFVAVIDEYTPEWFEKNSLIIMNLVESDRSAKCEVSQLAVDDYSEYGVGSFCGGDPLGCILTVQMNIEPGYEKCDINRFIFISIAKSDMEKCDIYDAFFERSVCNVTDMTARGDIGYDLSLEQFKNDHEYRYYLPGVKSDYIILEYNDGMSVNLKEAEYYYTAVEDFERFGILYYKVPNTPDDLKGKLSAIYVIDRTETENLSYSGEDELFFEDAEYEYYYRGRKGKYVIAFLSNNSYVTVKEALYRNCMTTDDLEKFGVEYYKVSKDR